MNFFGFLLGALKEYQMIVLSFRNLNLLGELVLLVFAIITFDRE